MWHGVDLRPTAVGGGQELATFPLLQSVTHPLSPTPTSYNPSLVSSILCFCSENLITRGCSTPCTGPGSPGREGFGLPHLDLNLELDAAPCLVVVFACKAHLVFAYKAPQSLCLQGSTVLSVRLTTSLPVRLHSLACKAHHVFVGLITSYYDSNTSLP